MKSFKSKLDINLNMIYMKYEEDKANGKLFSDAPAYNLSLRYDGDLSSIENAGFRVTNNQVKGFANGNVKLDDLELIASQPGVLSLSYGAKQYINLDKSVVDMKVRTNKAANLGTLGLWWANTYGKINSTPHNSLTGKGVIIGIIDTGIDVTHPSFMEEGAVGDTSRILRYWDQGLKPEEAGGHAGPDIALLGGAAAHSYGVEFDKTKIETFLHAFGARCPSKDCSGHGTHVAGIAAGNGKDGFLDQPVNIIGVAPEADIVVVKHLDVPDEIKDTDGNIISQSKRFRDAITYILEIAKSVRKPAVINCSFGGVIGAHDGLTEDEQWLDALFNSAGNRYSGNIVVFAAGNEAGKHSHAEIKVPEKLPVTVPASGEIIVPFTLYDIRSFATPKPGLTSPLIDIWYTEVTTPTDVSVRLKVPDDLAFSQEIFISTNVVESRYDSNKLWEVWHSKETSVSRPDGQGGTVNVMRNRIYLKITGNSRVTPGQHKEGLYHLKIKAPIDTIFQIYVTQEWIGFLVGTLARISEDAAKDATTLVVSQITGFQVNDNVQIELDDGTFHLAKITKITTSGGLFDQPIEIDFGLKSKSTGRKRISGVLSPRINVKDQKIIAANAGAKMVITVAAYDDNNGVLGDTHGKVARFSSVGPLADYSGLGPYAVKPDVAAPGVNINSARSKDMDGIALNISQLMGDRWTEMNGTSMAAPHITGLIALMLEKDNTLNVDDVRTILSEFANNRDGKGPVQADGPIYRETFGGGLADGVKIIDKTP